MYTVSSNTRTASVDIYYSNVSITVLCFKHWSYLLPRRANGFVGFGEHVILWNEI